MGPFLLGLALLLVVILGGRAFVQANPAQLAQAIKAFAAAFAMLAGTGLLFAGRIGLAVVTIGATVMALHAMRRGNTGAGPGFSQPPPGAAQASEVTTDSLRMRLDHASGELDGEVRRGPFAGRALGSLRLDDLLTLLQDCQQGDPRSVALLETYLDRQQPDWRDELARRAERGRAAGASRTSGAMDEATALSVLGLGPGAGEAEIKAAHRRLMAKLHPDHGGSGYLAAQLNEAKEILLRGRR
jgi:hypothetical protein